MEISRPSLKIILIYSLGQLGWSLGSYGTANLLVYFYMPPETSNHAIFHDFIYQGAIFGLFTIIGLVNFAGRIFDAFFDPFVANWSDKTVSHFGKRKKFMAFAVLPFALLSYLVFLPPASEPGTLNTIWLLLTIFLFYVAFAIYVIPYTALISELGHHPDDRMLISTIISVTWAAGFLIGNTAYALQGYFEKTMSPVSSFQTVVGIFAFLALLLMLVPVLFLKENKYSMQGGASENFRESLVSVLRNFNFRIFSGSVLMYWLSLTFIQLGVSFYITVLLELDKAYATIFLAMGLFTSFLLYVPINKLARRIGKKN